MLLKDCQISADVSEYAEIRVENNPIDKARSIQNLAIKTNHLNGYSNIYIAI